MHFYRQSYIILSRQIWCKKGFYSVCASETLFHTLLFNYSRKCIEQIFIYRDHWKALKDEGQDE
jgi:hypothetical protein